MKQMKKWWLFSLILLMSVCLGLAGGAVFAEQPVKTLVNVGKDAQDGAIWIEDGLPDRWVGEIDIINDAAQEDGGDVILRNEVEGDSFVSGEAAFSRRSIHPELAAYAVNGLELRFYLAANYTTGHQLNLMLTERSGWYLTSMNAIQIVITKQSDTTASIIVKHKSNSSGEFGGITNLKQDVPLYFDYDYFADRESDFSNPDAVGTVNILEIKGVDGVLKLFVNNTEILDLTEISQSVLTNLSEGMYLSAWSQAGSGSFAMRLTDVIENEVPVFENGAPTGYSLLNDSKIWYRLDSLGRPSMGNREDSGWDFVVRQEQIVDAHALDLLFRLNAENNLNFTVQLLDCSDKALSFDFECSGTSAELTVTAETGESSTALGSGRVPLYRDGRVNRITIEQFVKYFVEVNEQTIALDSKELSLFLNDFSETKICYSVTADAAVELYSVVAKVMETPLTRSYDGYILENTQLPVGDPIFYPILTNKAFRARYTATMLSVRNFRSEFALGGYGENGKFRIILSSVTDDFYDIESGNALILEFLRANEKTVLSLITADAGRETILKSAELAFDWNYDIRHVVAFGNNTVFWDESPILTLSKEEITEIETIIDGFDSLSGQMQFVCEGEDVLFTPYECSSFSNIADNEHWSVGGVGGMMSVGQSSEGALVLFDGGSAIHKKPVPVNGFHAEFRAWHMFSRVESYFSLGTSENWYQQEAGLMFSVTYVNADSVRLNIYDSERGQNTLLASAELPFHWNNGLKNSFDLRQEANGWVFYLNGKAIPGNATMTEKLATRANEYRDNTAFLQLWGSSDLVIELTKLSETVQNRSPQATGSLQEATTTTSLGVSVDLNKIFADPDGDQLIYRIVTGGGRLSNGIWNSAEIGEYTVTILAIDGRGGECEYTFEVTADKAGTGSGCNKRSSANAMLIVMCLLPLSLLRRKL